MIAEMLLIVLGITGALQLDNWNKLQENTRTEIVLLQQLQEEFIQIREDVIHEFNALTRNHEKLLKVYLNCNLEPKSYTNGEISEYISTSILPKYFSIKHGVLDEALNTGRISILNNDELRVLLYSFINSNEKVIAKMERYNKRVAECEHIYFDYIPTKDVDMKFFPDLGIKPSELAPNPNLIFQNLKFENIISFLHFYNEEF